LQIHLVDLVVSLDDSHGDLDVARSSAARHGVGDGMVAMLP